MGGQLSQIFSAAPALRSEEQARVINQRDGRSRRMETSVGKSGTNIVKPSSYWPIKNLIDLLLSVYIRHRESGWITLVLHKYHQDELALRARELWSSAVNNPTYSILEKHHWPALLKNTSM